MTEINNDFSALLNQRFNNGFDAVVDNINISYAAGARYPSVTMKIEIQDNLGDDGWSILKLNLHEVVKLRYNEGNATYRILSDGITFRVEEEFFLINFEDTSLNKSNFFLEFTKGFWGVEN